VTRFLNKILNGILNLINTVHQKLLAKDILVHTWFGHNVLILLINCSGADAINISGLLKPNKLGNLNNRML
jgi:hypothetical protein